MRNFELKDYNVQVLNCNDLTEIYGGNIFKELGHLVGYVGGAIKDFIFSGDSDPYACDAAMAAGAWG